MKLRDWFPKSVKEWSIFLAGFFFIAGAGHFLRFLFDWGLIIEDFSVPREWSLAIALLAVLAFYSLMHSYRKRA